MPLYNTTLPSNHSLCVHDDEAFKYRAYTITYLLLFPVAFLSNGGALVVFLFLSQRSSAPNVLMINLALSDASFSLTLPLRLAYYFNGACWDFPDWLCRLCVFCFYLSLYTSILFLTALSALRWLAVLHPLRHRSLATPRRAVLMCVALWLFVGGMSSPFLFHGIKWRAGLPRCFEPANPASWGRVLVLNYLGIVFGFFVPLVTILGCYGSIVHTLTASGGNIQGAGIPGNRDSQRGSQRRRRQRYRSTRLIALVTGTFLLCFLPYHVARSLHLHAVVGRWGCVSTATLQRLLVVTLCLAAGNSVANPVVYYCSSHTFRNTLHTHTRCNRKPSHTLTNPSFMLLRRNSTWATHTQSP